MKHYLYLPFKKCKNCKYFDASCSRAYTCHTNKNECPAFEIQIVVRDSVVSLVSEYKQAIKTCNLDAQSVVLDKVRKSGKAFEYKFKKELKNAGSGQSKKS